MEKTFGISGVRGKVRWMWGWWGGPREGLVEAVGLVGALRDECLLDPESEGHPEMGVPLTMTMASQGGVGKLAGGKEVWPGSKGWAN